MTASLTLSVVAGGQKTWKQPRRPQDDTKKGQTLNCFVDMSFCRYVFAKQI